MDLTVRQTSHTAVAGWPEADRRRLDALFDVLAFPTSSSFRLGGEPAIEAERVRSPKESDADALIEILWTHLYERCYARTYAPQNPSDPVLMARPYQRDQEFVAALSAAHTTPAAWDPAWQVLQVGSDGSVRVRKGDRFRQVGPGQYAFAADPTRPPRVDEPVDLLASRESFIIHPQYYYAYGRALGCDFDAADQSRFYFHATDAGMPGLLAIVGGALNRFDIPYLFKCRDDPDQFDRADSAVLYVPSRFLAVTLRLLDQLDGSLDGLLRPDVPLFTRELRPGVGMADHPPGSESFGQIRCVLLARGLVDGLLAGRQSREDRHRAVAARFARAGLDPARPHLNPGYSDRYHRPAPSPWPAITTRITGNPLTPGPAREEAFLEAADRIGSRLCRDALWAGGRCNWMTWAVPQFSGRPTLVHRSAPPGRADGVAGIALFLAHLWRRTGDRHQGDTLGAAIRQLLTTAPNMTDPSFPSGRLGIGHALVAIGGILEDKDLGDAGIGLMGSVSMTGGGGIPAPNDADLSGAIIALIDVGSRSGRPELLGLAHNYGQALLDRLQAPQIMGSHPIEPLGPSGALNGRIGIAHALLELDRLTAAAHLRLAAMSLGPTTVPEDGHSLLRVRELLGDATGTTSRLEDAIRRASEALASPRAGDLSLRGLAGQADFLLEAAASLGRPGLWNDAERFGNAVVELFHRPDLPWPCGIPGAGEVPDLMAGTAGIGLALLRLGEPASAPSPLLPRPAGG